MDVHAVTSAFVKRSPSGSAAHASCLQVCRTPSASGTTVHASTTTTAAATDIGTAGGPAINAAGASRSRAPSSWSAAYSSTHARATSAARPVSHARHRTPSPRESQASHDGMRQSLLARVARPHLCVAASVFTTGKMSGDGSSWKFIANAIVTPWGRWRPAASAGRPASARRARLVDARVVGSPAARGLGCLMRCRKPSPRRRPWARSRGRRGRSRRRKMRRMPDEPGPGGYQLARQPGERWTDVTPAVAADVVFPHAALPKGGRVGVRADAAVDRELAWPRDSAPCCYGLPTRRPDGVRCTAGCARTDTR